MSATNGSTTKDGQSKVEDSKSGKRKREEDDILDANVSNEIEDILSVLHPIKQKANNGMEKKEETISSVVSEIKAMHDELQAQFEKDRQTFAKALLKSAKENDNAKFAKFQQLYDNFYKEKVTHLQALQDTILKLELDEERGTNFMPNEQQSDRKKTMLSEHEKTCTDKIAQLEESLKKKQCENSLMNETATVQALNEKSCKEVGTHLQALEDTISYFEDKKDRLFMGYERQSVQPTLFIRSDLESLLQQIVCQEDKTPGQLVSRKPESDDKDKGTRASNMFNRMDEPFLFSKSRALCQCEIYYTGDRSSVLVNFTQDFDIREWAMAGHDAKTGWILLIKDTSVLYYNVLEHRMFLLCEAPFDFAAIPPVIGCFTGDPELQNSVTMIVYFGLTSVNIYRHSRTSGWSEEITNTNYQMFPNGQLTAHGNYYWVDRQANILNIVLDWADISSPLRYQVVELPEHFSDMPITTALVGSDVFIISHRDNNHTAFNVRRIKIEDGEWTIEEEQNFRGYNIYATYRCSGFGLRPRPTFQRNNDAMPGNILYLSTLDACHCSRYTNFDNLVREDDKRCFSPVNLQDVMEAEEGVNLDQNICACSAFWFNIQRL